MIVVKELVGGTIEASTTNVVSADEGEKIYVWTDEGVLLYTNDMRVAEMFEGLKNPVVASTNDD